MFGGNSGRRMRKILISIILCLMLCVTVSAQTITHVIVIVKENRSFDNYFGAFVGYSTSAGWQGVQSYCTGGSSPAYPNQAVCHYGNPTNECSTYSGTCPQPITLSKLSGSAYSLYLENSTVNYNDNSHTHDSLLGYNDNGLQDKYLNVGCPNSGGNPTTASCGYAYFDSTQLGGTNSASSTSYANGTYYYFAANYGLSDNFYGTTTPSAPGHFYIFAGQNHGLSDNALISAGAKTCYPGSLVNPGQSQAGIACSTNSTCQSNQCGCPASICTGLGGPSTVWWSSGWACGAQSSGAAHPVTYAGTWMSAVGTPTSINTGVVSIGGTGNLTVTLISGQQFNLGWAGQSVYFPGVSGTAYTIASVASGTSMTLTTSPGAEASVTYTLDPMLCTTGKGLYNTVGTACLTAAQCGGSYPYCTPGAYQGGVCSNNGNACACFGTAGNPSAAPSSTCVDQVDCSSSSASCSVASSIEGNPGAPCPNLTTIADQAQLASVNLNYYDSSGSWNPTTYVSNLYDSAWFATHVSGENKFATDAASVTGVGGVCSGHTATACGEDSTCSGLGYGSCVDPSASTLPPISYLGTGNPQNPDASEHPAAGPISAPGSTCPGASCGGMQWTAAQIAAVVGSCTAGNLSSPNCYLWNHTIIFVTWDDTGGFWDHVPQQVVDGLNLGNRIPFLCIGALCVNGITHLQMEHASVLRCIEQLFSITPIGSRDVIANDACFGTGTKSSPGTGANAGMVNLSQALLNPPGSPPAAGASQTTPGTIVTPGSSIQ
jgi:hypothetical protein